MTIEFFLKTGSIVDFEQLYKIYMEPNINRFLNFEIMNKLQFQNIFDELIHSGQLYIYEYKNQVVATAIAIRHKRRTQHSVTISTLATHPEFQGQGIGSRFMKELINTLKNEGIKRIDLYAEADNPIALNFYEKLGFQHEGTLKKYFKRNNEDSYVDEYIMALIFD